VLSTYDTGDIPISATDPATWVKYGLYFTTPVGVSTIVLRMHNNASGGIGNDLGLDDITFSPAGPKTTIGLNGSAADTLNFTCVYGSANFVATVANCYLNSVFQWQTSADTINWANIPGATGSGYNFTPSGAGTYYFRVNVANQGNTGNANCSINSNTFTVIYSVPAVHNISAAICPGQYYTLPSGKTVNTAGMHYDSLLNREGCDSITTILNLTISSNSSASIAVAICRGQAYAGHTTAGTYIDTLQAANGCDSLVTVTLTVNPNLDLGPDRNLCAGDSIILNPGAFSQYLWQDGSTLPYYKVKSGGLYSVTVTDENGCMGTDSVPIKEIDCSLTNIPNTFTPNGDGINDTWEIDALQAFPNCTVAIYTRWGQQVFKSTGYAKPFDGNYNGKELPVGTYYYVISLTNNSPPVAGFVTIIR
jgi:gliding motility-associated-like protein